MFFVWLSVFNLFVVSVFWSFMADLFDDAQAARLYGAIAAGGSCGAIAGPALTALAVTDLGASNLLLVSALLLVAAVGCIQELLAWAPALPAQGRGTAPGSRSAARSRPACAPRFSSPYLLGICAYLLCYTALSTTLYFQQVRSCALRCPTSAERTRLFATIDLVVNSLTLIAAARSDRAARRGSSASAGCSR